MPMPLKPETVHGRDDPEIADRHRHLDVDDQIVRAIGVAVTGARDSQKQIAILVRHPVDAVGAVVGATRDVELTAIITLNI